jgi:oligopeptide transport system substrate-binding protein
MRIRSFITALLFLSTVGCQQSDTPESRDPDPRKSIKISLEDDIDTLDPRQARTLIDGTASRLLFEGLYRFNEKGTLVPGIAEKVEISPDQKTYTFTLRPAQWSNGDKLSAEDFVYSWSKILDPAFAAPNAYQLFPIKNGKAVKEGKLPLDALGIKASAPNTLVVELEQPTPYFLELTAFHAFFPFNQLWEKSHPDWQKQNQKELPVNGPFVLEKWARKHVLIAKKNPLYWDAPSVKLDAVTAMILEPNTAYQMYTREALNWAGSPLNLLPPDAIPTLKSEQRLRVAPAAGTHWFRFNTQRAPFDNVHMRLAFAYALNREEIANHILQGGQVPALGIIPPSLGWENKTYFSDNNVEKARELFQKALDEKGITKDQLPPIYLSYKPDERSHKIAQAVQQQWQKAFNIPIILDGCEAKCFFEKINTQNYQIGSGSWFADFRDPINFLEIFKAKSNKTNNTNWENPQYTLLINQAMRETDLAKRKELLQQAETILMQEMPVAPLFFYAFNYVKSDVLKGVYFSDLGYLDFRNAYMDYNRINEE